MSLLELEDLRVAYPSGRGDLLAVDGVDLSVPANWTVGLVGESGSGKSTLAKAVVGLVPISGGSIRLHGADLSRLSARERTRLRKRVQLIFQDPYSSLNPRMTVREAIAEPLIAHFSLSRAERQREVERLLRLVGLSPSDANHFPFQFSGGQRQRIAIARALAVRPELIVADEITSALDVSVQSAILNLLQELQRETGVSCLLISHNLAVVRFLSESIAVMHLGKIVEVGLAEDIFTRPHHPYTRALIDSVPRLHHRGESGFGQLSGDLPDPHDPPSGCRFRTRCPIGPLTHRERTVCVDEDPHRGAKSRPHLAACHFTAELGPGPPSIASMETRHPVRSEHWSAGSGTPRIRRVT
jgi:peptide/nickel transport system ATP-binding protein